MFGFKKGKLSSKDKVPTREFVSLLEFLLNEADDRSFEGLFLSVERYLQNYYQASNLLVFSTPTNDKTRSIADSYRTVFNREKVGTEIPNAEVAMAISMWDEHQLEGSISFSHERDHYYSFVLGDWDGQRYFCLFSTTSEKAIQNEILFYLSSFVSKGLRTAYEWRALKEENSLIHIDDVTGLYNQRKLILDLNELITLYSRFSKSFVVLFIDIDHFKDVNDNYGHLVGTQILKELSRVFRDKMRDTDYIYRYGGDEFVIILPDCSSSTGHKIGERLLNIIRNHTFELDGIGDFKLSVSIGVASFPKDSGDWKGILEIADKMMYSAKHQGRSRVCLAGQLFE
ncbi:MAG: GGDEF domain-containing protein [Bacteriovoracaceae bacterium]|nr:GGDEF domain-containing protein [Bacteriovoracaceae bacterium]